jgi:hypothetical protein
MFRYGFVVHVSHDTTREHEPLAPVPPETRVRAGRHPATLSNACPAAIRPSAVVRRLIAGPNGAYICDSCVTLCNQILAKETEPPAEGEAGA